MSNPIATIEIAGRMCRERRLDLLPLLLSLLLDRVTPA